MPETIKPFLSVFRFSFAFIIMFAVAAIETSHSEVIRIEVSSEPFHPDQRDPARTVFGKLTWKGGLILKSESDRFGGISGLLIDSEGKKITAVTDHGDWLIANLAYKNSILYRVNDVNMGPLLDKKPFSLMAKQDIDAESITVFNDRYLVSFERQHKIRIFEKKVGFPGEQSGEIALPEEARNLPFNDGIEALTFLQGGEFKGALIMFAEKQSNGNDRIAGWMLHDNSTRPIYLKAIDGYAVTDAASLEDGSLIILERYYRASEGVKMRIRQVNSSEIKPGAILLGSILFQADNSLLIDNMEGLAIHKDEQGSTILTIVSDNNFSEKQKTLLMQFKLNQDIVKQ